METERKSGTLNRQCVLEGLVLAGFKFSRAAGSASCRAVDLGNSQSDSHTYTCIIEACLKSKGKNE